MLNDEGMKLLKEARKMIHDLAPLTRKTWLDRCAAYMKRAKEQKMKDRLADRHRKAGTARSQREDAIDVMIARRRLAEIKDSGTF